MNEIKTEKDFIEVVSGLDDNNIPKGAISFTKEIWAQNGDKKEVDNRFYDSPVINIVRNNSYVIIDLDFRSRLNNNLISCWNYLESYSELFTESLKDGEVPTLIMTIIAKEYLDEYYILAMNPIFQTLQPQSPLEDISVIRIIFELDNFEVFQGELIEEI